MTAVADRPVAGRTTDVPPGRSGPTAPGRPDPVVQGTLAAEVTLTLVTVVVALGLGRLLEDLSWRADVVVSVVAAHTLSAIVRRAGWGLVTSTLASLVGLAVVVAWLRYPDTLWWALPGRGTLDALGDDLRVAWDQFGHVKAPAEVLPGFVVAAMAALWVFAHAADTAAFRVLASFEALLPAVVVFVFTSMLANDRARILASVAFLAAALGFVLAHRLGRRPSGPRSGDQAGVLAVTGLALTVGAAAIGAVVGPRLPGAAEEALVDWKSLDGGGGGGGRVALSPLVDIRGRLVDQADVEVFRVEADDASYWRTTALDTFDGSIWGFGGRYVDASGPLEPSPLPPATVELEQTVTISELSDIWLPTAYAPVALTFGGDIRHDPGSATLITEGRTRRGDIYTVVSASPRYDPDQLRAAPPEPDAAFVARFTELPADFSEGARLLAEEITAGAGTDYDAMLMLQDWFVGNFTYDIDVGAGHDTSRVDRFLNDRRGYCEQFAGTFAAMARHLGVPARVAVGFTPGNLVAEGVWSVRGEHYHAWPEVWFAGQGWVLFEPTPGRGAPNAVAHTGREVQQAVAGDPNEATALDETPPPTTASTGPVAPFGDELFDPGLGLDTGPGGEAIDDDPSNPWPARVGLALLAGALLGGAWALVVPWLRARQRRRRHLDRSPAEAAWTDLEEHLGMVGIRRHETETRAEFAERAAVGASLPRPPLAGAAVAADHEGFGPTDDDTVAARAEQLVADIERMLAERASGSERFLRRIDPRPLLPSWRRRLPGSP